MARILICHVPKDGTPARELGATLMGRGHFVSFDGEPDTLRADRSARMRQFEAVVVMWTEHSLASAGLSEIAREALPLNLLVSVKAENVSAASLPLILRKLNMYAPREIDGIARLVARLSTAASSIKEMAAREARREDEESTRNDADKKEPQAANKKDKAQGVEKKGSGPTPFTGWPVRSSALAAPANAPTPADAPTPDRAIPQHPVAQQAQEGPAADAPAATAAAKLQRALAAAQSAATPSPVSPPPLGRDKQARESARAHRPLVLPEVHADEPPPSQPQRRMVTPPPLPPSGPSASRKGEQSAAPVTTPEEFAALVDAGLLLVHIPHATWLGEPIVIEVRLGRQRPHARNSAPLPDRGTIETISVSLYGSTAFEIERQSERTQFVNERFSGSEARDPGVIGRWAWLVTPRVAGNQELVLRISALLRDNRGVPVPVALSDRRYSIAIHVPEGASLVSAMPGWTRQ